MVISPSPPRSPFLINSEVRITYSAVILKSAPNQLEKSTIPPRATADTGLRVPTYLLMQERPTCPVRGSLSLLGGQP